MISCAQSTPPPLMRTSEPRSAPGSADSDRHGIQYGWNNDVTVDATYEYLNAGEAKIDQDGGPLTCNGHTKSSSKNP